MNREHTVARAFFEALAANDESALLGTMAPDAGLRAWRSGARISTGPAERVVRWFGEERSRWDEATFDLLRLTTDGDQATIEFRIQSVTRGRVEDQERVALIAFEDARIRTIHLYCEEPMLAARRGWIAPVDVEGPALDQLLETYNRDFDPRRPVFSNRERVDTSNFSRMTTGEAYPGSNTVICAQWSADEAEDRITELVEWHRERNIGFQWIVGPWDTPRDLRQRLERHGLMLAGDQAMMLRRGLDPHDVPVNPDIAIEELDGSDEAAMESALQITGAAFEWPPEAIANQRDGFFGDIRSRENHHFLARLDGVPVAEAALAFKSGFAYLAGAATLPEYRSRRIYSTLLHKRLQVAHESGYHLALIISEPMSRRVVSRYGFEPKAMFYLYGWMPVMDPAVIRTLVQDQ